MKLKIKVTGHLVDYFSGDEAVLPAGASIEEVLSGIGIPLDEVGLVAVNGSAVKKADRGTAVLNDGDNVTVMAPLTGG